jgi:hypothetical protein
MTSPVASPFREDDATLRLAELRARRDELSRELARLDGEIVRRQPWSWKRFVLGVALSMLAATVLAFVFARP